MIQFFCFLYHKIDFTCVSDFLARRANKVKNVTTNNTMMFEFVFIEMKPPNKFISIKICSSFPRKRKTVKFRSMLVCLLIMCFITTVHGEYITTNKEPFCNT